MRSPFLARRATHQHKHLHLSTQNTPTALGRVLGLLAVGFQGYHTGITPNSPHKPSKPPALVKRELNSPSLTPAGEVLQLLEQLLDGAHEPHLASSASDENFHQRDQVRQILVELVL